MRANKRKSGKFEHSAKGAARRWGAKSVLTLCLAAAFAVALTIGGTLAYLKNKTDTVTNTFRAGQIQYKLNLEPNAQLVNHQNEDVTMPGNLVAEQTNTATSVDFTYDNHPTMPGYTFDGWYYDKDCEEEYTDFSEKTITVNYGDEHDSHTAPNKVEITLYAKWTANTDTPYTVRHWVQKLNAGKEHTEANFDLRDTEHLTGTTDTEVTPAVKNYEGFTAPITQTVTILGDGSTVVDYYYTRNSYTVTLNKGTGIETVTGAGTYQYGASVTIDATLKTGYKWANWTGEHNTNTQEYTFTMPAKDVVDTANGEAITYTVLYNQNGDDKAGITGSTASSTHIYDVPKNLTKNGYERTGYTFIGWNTQADGKGTSYADEESVRNLTSVDGATVTLYAQWGAKSYVLRYHPNGGEGTMADQIIKYDELTVLHKNTFTKNDYSFAGWATSTGGDVEYLDEQKIVNLLESGTLNLYAVWIQNSHTVYFEYNFGTEGGSGSPDSKLFQNNHPYGQLPEYPMRNPSYVDEDESKSYLFEGWYTEKTGGTRVYASTIAQATENHTLYAHWIAAPTNNIIKDIKVSNNPDDNFDGVVDDVNLNFKCSGNFEKFNIPLGNLIKGQKYKLTYTASHNASFGDGFGGYSRARYGSYIVKDAVYSSSNIDDAIATDIIATWENRIEPDGNNDGSQKAINDSWLQGPWNRTIVFTASADKMFWAWEFGLMEDGYQNQYNIKNIILEPVPPTIEFASKTELGNGSFVSQTNSEYGTTFTFDGESGCETVYYPITGLNADSTYTITFDHEFRGKLIDDISQVSSPRYEYGCGIMNPPSAEQPKPNKTGDKLTDLGKWASQTFIKRTVDNKIESVTLTFKATSDTAYWVWNMANCTDSQQVTTRVTVTKFSASHEGGNISYYEAPSNAGKTSTLAMATHDELEFDFNIDIDELGAFANDMPTAGKDFIMEFDPAEGYEMPETILVRIDGVDHIYTLDDLYAGDDEEGNPLYQLWIPGDLLKDAASMYIEAKAIEITEPETESTEPATQPTEPATQPTEPATQPTEPVTQPTEPATQPTEPATQPTEPATQPTEPATQPTEPVTEPSEPETEPTDPSEAATEPTVAATDPTEMATLPPEETDPTEETEEVTE